MRRKFVKLFLRRSLGLKLPSYDFWGLLRGEMITAITEAKAKAKAKATAKAA